MGDGAVTPAPRLGALALKLSTRGRYGLKAMIDLALQYGEGPVPLRDVAERQRLSEHYLEQLVAPLRRAGLVTSSRGAQGGYELAREPAKISIGDIVRVLEGPLSLVDCLDNGASACDQTSICLSRSVWRRLRDSMENVLDSTTLADVTDEALTFGGSSGRTLGCPSGVQIGDDGA